MRRDRLSSKERLLAAMSGQEPDRTPVWLHFVEDASQYGEEGDHSFCRTYGWSSVFDRVDELQSLGIDDGAELFAPSCVDPSVTVRVHREEHPGVPYPVLVKSYETPRGELRTSVKATGDWPHGDDIPLFADHAVSRRLEPLVKCADDLEKLRYLLEIPTGASLSRFRELARKMKRYSTDTGTMLFGWAGSTADVALWLCDWQQMVFSVVDDPAFLQGLMDVVHAWEMKRIEMLLDEAVDVVVHRAWYETTHLWSPAVYRQFFAPRIREEVDLVHAAGRKFQYCMTTGSQPILDTFLQLGFDALRGVDPVLGGADLDLYKSRLSPGMCLQGGMSSTTVEQGSEEEVRRAIATAGAKLGPRGFILEPVDGIVLPRESAWPRVVSFARLALEA